MFLWENFRLFLLETLFIPQIKVYDKDRKHIGGRRVGMASENKCNEWNELPRIYRRRMESAVFYFERRCKERENKGEHSCTAYACELDYSGDAECRPIEFDTQKDADIVRDLILNELSTRNLLYYEAKVYKMGPYYSSKEVLGVVSIRDKSAPYYKYQIQISVSWK